MATVVSRDNFYLLLGVVIFAAAFLILTALTDWPVLNIFIVAFLISLASDILIVIDNERRNTAPDAKLHHRNELVGEIAAATEDFHEESGMYVGKINLRGESWRAASFEPDLKTGDQVRIIDRTGMTFMVKKC